MAMQAQPLCSMVPVKGKKRPATAMDAKHGSGSTSPPEKKLKATHSGSGDAKKKPETS